MKEEQVKIILTIVGTNIDDLRESPAIIIVQELVKNRLGRILVVELNITKLPIGFSSTDRLQLVDLDKAIQKADILVLLVDHKEFDTVSSYQYKNKVIIDTRGLWSIPAKRYITKDLK